MARRKHRQVTWILAGTVVLLGLDAIAWLLWAAWHLLPWLLAITVAVLACRRWQLHRRVLAWVRDAGTPAVPPRVVQGHVTDQAADLDRAEVTRLRDQNSAMRKKIQILSETINGPKVRP
jgi:apolipoprotein N-acyltransferase